MRWIKAPNLVRTFFRVYLIISEGVPKNAWVKMAQMEVVYLTQYKSLSLIYLAGKRESISAALKPHLSPKTKTKNNFILQNQVWRMSGNLINHSMKMAGGFGVRHPELARPQSAMKLVEYSEISEFMSKLNQIKLLQKLWSNN